LKISVVIPTLNEAEALPETIRCANEVPEVSEIIVVDGGSSDQTREIAARLGCQVLKSKLGRGTQMRLGAAQATGDVVILLHADTWLPQNAGRAIQFFLHDQRVVGGGFWKIFREPHWLMRGSRFKCAVRFCLFRRFMGDQAIFVRREILKEVGGIPDVPLMEEFELCRALQRKGKLVLANAVVQTSARRFLERGVLRTYWRMFIVTARYFLRESPEELRKRYD
jgi:rSAM/selenodomain-associated transferase 2